ncbi:MAG: glycosyltransferase family 4 protein [Candidatus Aenigmarchaeota archaeon]|nr:glycosyltransferase family 4 protein [Candidatus Aenigmarchaeota archaeon]
MKILMTQDLFPPDVAGGGETLSLKIATELANKGYEIKVICSGDYKIKKYQGIESIRIPINRYLMNFSFPIIKKYSKDVDVIHTSSGNVCYASYLASRISKKPILCYIHHIFGKNWKVVRGPIIGSAFETMEKFYLVRDYDAYVFQNNLSKKIGVDIGIRRDKINILTPGTEVKKYDYKKKEDCVLFVGNFSMDKFVAKIKGLDNLIESAKIMKETDFIIVGGGSYIEKLKTNSPDNVFFTGPLKDKEIVNVYNKASIFCLPSLTEGFGITILEAMSAGCAVTSTVDIGQCGNIMSSNSVNQIIKNIRYYKENPRVTRKYGLENRKIAKKYTWGSFLKRLIDIYDSIITERSEI